MQPWQSGGISSEEFFWNLQRGEVIRGDKSFEEHQEELENQGPGLGNFGVNSE